jgi:hypothetical protein
MLNSRPQFSLEPAGPFTHRGHGRALSFLVDAPCVLPELPNRLLLALGGRDSVRVYSAVPGTSGGISFGGPVAGQYYLPVSVDGPDGQVAIGVPAWESVERTAGVLAAEHRVDEERAKTVLSLAALVRSSDVFDELVLSEECQAGPLGRYARTALTPAEAVALLGLALRASGDFAIAKKGSTTVVISPRWFYRAVALAHVTGLEAWLGAALAVWHDGNPEPMRLADGIATRLGRALRARDYIQVRLRSRDFEATWDEVLFFFDAVLTQLMGALDQLARLLQAVYVIKSRRPSWRRKEWLEELTAADPRVGELAQPGQEVADVIDLVAEMRNHIHEAPLSDETAHAGDGAGVLVWGPGVVALPFDGVGATLVELAERRGGLDGWGISDRRVDTTIVLDAGLFAEKALRETTAVIELVLDTADHQRPRDQIPADLSRWVPAPADREAARWLLGLDAGGLRQERATFA